jgi:hypothetical protein
MEKLKFWFAGALVVIGFVMVVPMVMFWDAIQIQAALGNTALLDSYIPLGAGGLGALALGMILLKLNK